VWVVSYRDAVCGVASGSGYACMPGSTLISYLTCHVSVPGRASVRANFARANLAHELGARAQPVLRARGEQARRQALAAAWIAARTR